MSAIALSGFEDWLDKYGQAWDGRCTNFGEIFGLFGVFL
jgi:hypothetical protein